MSFGGRGGAPGYSDQYIMERFSVKLSLNGATSCFQQCVSSFNDDKLSQQEKTCISSCAKRLGQSFEALSAVQDQAESKLKAGGGMF